MPAERMEAHLELGPVWLLGSEENRGLANPMWASSSYPNGHVTVFDDMSDPAGLIQSISEHHPNWTVIEIFGIAQSEIEGSGLGQVAFDTDANIASIYRKAGKNA